VRRVGAVYHAHDQVMAKVAELYKSQATPRKMSSASPSCLIESMTPQQRSTTTPLAHRSVNAVAASTFASPLLSLYD
jgi:hypothetical protein